MGRKKKNITKNEKFYSRFAPLCYNDGKSQEKLAEIFDVSRPTLGGWLIGEGTPNMHSLVKIAQYFNVSTDYLLGLSEQKSSDASARAAAAYTGLSEEAIECLHMGLDDIGCGLSEEGKEEHLMAASSLVQDDAFVTMVENLGQLEQLAYEERILEILTKNYLGYGPAGTERRIDRDTILQNVIPVCRIEEFFEGKDILSALHTMDNKELRSFVLSGYIHIKDDVERCHFGADRAFTRYINQLIETGYQKAEKGFKHKS